MASGTCRVAARVSGTTPAEEQLAPWPWWPCRGDRASARSAWRPSAVVVTVALSTVVCPASPPGVRQRKTDSIRAPITAAIKWLLGWRDTVPPGGAAPSRLLATGGSGTRERYGSWGGRTRRSSRRRAHKHAGVWGGSERRQGVLHLKNRRASRGGGRCCVGLDHADTGLDAGLGRARRIGLSRGTRRSGRRCSLRRSRRAFVCRVRRVEIAGAFLDAVGDAGQGERRGNRGPVHAHVHSMPGQEPEQERGQAEQPSQPRRRAGLRRT